MDDNEISVKPKLSKKIILLIIGISIVVIIILVALIFLLSGKKDKEINLEEHLLNVGKSYYQEQGLLPTIEGECKNITLEELLSKNRIEEPSIYKECNKYNSYVKACKLGTQKYHYVPILSCEAINSEELYTEWKDGTKNNITSDTDVRFLFLGYEKINNTTDEVLEAWEDELENVNYEVIDRKTYYRYRDKEWLWQEITNEYYSENDIGNVVAYYDSIPNNEYLNSDSETTVYKWYRNITVNQDLQKVYICKEPESLDIVVSLNETCESRVDGKIEIQKEYYTCGVKDIDGNYIEVSSDAICDCSSNQYGTNCEVKKAYYPSGEGISNKENVYYEKAPVIDAIKDVSTKTNASRYYKEVITTTDKYYSNRPSSTAIKVEDGRFKDWTEYSTIKPRSYNTREIESRVKVKYKLKETEDNWKKINNNHQTIEEFINKLQSLNYEVKTLKDIKNNEQLKYELKLQYRIKNK